MQRVHQQAIVASSAHRRSIDYCSVLLLVLLSGSPVFNNEFAIKFTLPAYLGYALLAYKRYLLKKEFASTLVFLVLGFLAVYAAQILEFGGAYPWMASLILKVLAGGLVIFAVGSRFPSVLLMVMGHICIASLGFYFLQLYLGVDSFPNWFPTFAQAENRKSILVHTLVTTDALRNAGPFWEPGAFQGFINLVFMLHPLSSMVARRGRGRFLFLLLALISTFSTAGYLTFALLILLKVLLVHRGGALRYLVAFLCALAAVSVYSELDFIGAKIEAELLYTSEHMGEYNPSRSGALLFDLHYIEKNPMFGNGFAFETRFSDHPFLAGLNLGHGNGFSGFIAGMGLFGFSIFFLALFRSSLFTDARSRLTAGIFLIVLLQGQQFLLLPIFLALPFLRKGVHS